MISNKAQLRKFIPDLFLLKKMRRNIEIEFRKGFLEEKSVEGLNQLCIRTALLNL